MITKILTGITYNDYNPSVDLEYYINDTFMPSSPLIFSCPLNYLNDLISKTINSGNISTHKLYVRITESLNTPLNILFEKTYVLSTSNIQNNSLIVSIKDLTDNISHDFLCDNTAEFQKQNLYKTYKIIFRIFSNSEEAVHLQQKLNLLSTDIAQDLNLCFNTAESGPYEVSFNVIDVLSPNDFTSSNLIAKFTSNTNLINGEGVRCIYPENVSSCPLVVFMHGAGHKQSDYDAYMTRIASYGYFCISLAINHGQNSSILELPSSSNSQLWGSDYLLKLVDHIKTNQSVISNQFFLNKINFSKINLIGHSRGGGIIHLAKLLLNRKNSSFSQIKSISINSNDIISLIKIAPVDDQAINADGRYVRETSSNPITQIQENIISYFSRYIETPVLTVRSRNDSDASYVYNIDDLQSGITYSTKRNLSERIIITNNHLSHGELRESFGDSESETGGAIFQTGSNSDPILYDRNEDYLNYNSTNTDLCFLASEFIYFLSCHNYNSQKIKKLRFNRQNNYHKKINTEKIPNSFLSYPPPSSIKYILDEYNGITLSYAGITGLTFTNIGHTYDLGNDSDYYRVINTANFSTGITYLQALKDLKVSGLPVGYYTVTQPRFFVNDTFNGIQYCLYKSLFLPIQSNFSLGYTLSSNISLAENDYLCITGSLKYIPSANGNTMDANFNLTLYDNNLNTSTLSSKMCGGGFSKIITPFRDTGWLSENDSVNTVNTTNVYFRAGDFSLKNKDLNLSNITQILFNFGPNYGSTFAHLALDDFIVVKEI